MSQPSVGSGHFASTAPAVLTASYAVVANNEPDIDGDGDLSTEYPLRGGRHVDSKPDRPQSPCLSCSLLLLTVALLLLILAAASAVLWYTGRVYSLQRAAIPVPAPPTPTAHFDEASVLSSRRGHIALVYSGTMRTFSDCFHSHLINLIAPSPYTVHIFMQADLTDAAEFARLDATLDYYAGWQDLDNRYIPTRSAIKATAFSPRTNLSVIAELYARELAVIGDEFADTEPTRVLAQFESLRLGNELRLQYENATGVQYAHVFRMRWDMTFRTSVWPTLFHIEPRLSVDPLSHLAGPGHVAERWMPAVGSVFVLYDFVYSYRVDSSELIVPACDWYNGGYNDQFSISNSSVMTLLSNRGHDMAVFDTDVNGTTWRFHAENFFRRVMDFHGVRTATMADECHSKLESNGDACGVNGYGAGCCAAYCPTWRAMEQRMTERVRPFHTLASYVAHLPVEWNVSVGSSSFQSYWRHLRPEYSVSCLAEEQRAEPSPGMLPQPNPYFHLQLPYIVRRQEQLQRFLAHDLCPPS